MGPVPWRGFAASAGQECITCYGRWSARGVCRRFFLYRRTSVRVFDSAGRITAVRKLLCARACVLEYRGPMYRISHPASSAFNFCSELAGWLCLSLASEEGMRNRYFHRSKDEDYSKLRAIKCDLMIISSMQ